MKHDVIIIGAGYAGLAASKTLWESGKKILVLEARERTGGRVHTQYLPDGNYADLGGQWIGPGHSRMYALARHYNINTFPTYDKGKSTLLFNNKQKHYKGIIPPLPLFALLSLNSAVKKMTKLSGKTDLAEPWNSMHAKEYDGMSLKEWMHAQIKNDTARKMFTIAAEAIYATDTSAISFLHALMYVKSNKNFNFLMNIKKGAQQDRIAGGAQSICHKIADMLGGQLRLNSPVYTIEQSAEGVKVLSNGIIHEASKIIIAIPPPVAREIHFTKALPRNRLQLMNDCFMGSVVKCYAVYTKPFWRDQNLNGLCAAPDEIVSVSFDNSPADGNKGMLMGLALGDKAKQLMRLSEPDRRETVLQCFGRMLGEEALHPETYLEKSFTEEPLSKGCYAGMFPRNSLTQYATSLAAPAGHIHWAGTETSTEWNGYMEGAVRSGERAAKEIIALL